MKKRMISVVALVIFAIACETNAKEKDKPSPTYDAVNRKITVDGNVGDWKGIKKAVVKGEDHLWFGQGMTREKWGGDKDLSYTWRATWSGDKLYFLFEVNDDKLIDPAGQPNSYLNDCIEILLDHKNRGGKRYVERDGKKTLRGYEMHFLPSSPHLVFLDDALSPLYPMNKPQNATFKKDWAGEVKAKKMPTGYVMEIGLSVPGVKLGEGTVMGIDTDVCDDDGKGRKALQIWTGKQVEFWVTMEHYGKLRLVE